MSHDLLIQLDHVGLKYRLKRPLNGSRVHWALEDISLKLHQGETLGVIGSNGAGKSTLMKLLADFVAHDRGKVFRKRDVKVSLLAFGIGFEGTLSGRENAILSGLLFGLHRKTIEKRMQRIIEFSELGEFIDQPYYTYSTGMGARLGFSVAMEVDPDVLLLDEVMGVGDMRFAEKSSKIILEKIKSNMTVVLISHDPSTIRNLCTRATWIDHGITQCEGSTEEVTARYEHFMKTGQK
ncbi:MAG: ABC transporter ATP-binding protein [Verrucomicrobiota bacterium]